MQKHEKLTIADRLEDLIERSDSDLGIKIIEGQKKIHCSEIGNQDLLRMAQDILESNGEYLIKSSGTEVTVIRTVNG